MSPALPAATALLQRTGKELLLGAAVMDGGLARRVENGVDLVAAALFAAAVAFAAWALGGASVHGPATVLVWIATFLLARAALKRLGARQVAYPLPAFPVTALEPRQLPRLEELVLTDADRIPPAVTDQPLLLDDALPSADPNARVVRLFDAAAMPTPGQLVNRIDRHLAGGSHPQSSPDQSEALFTALAELRRSLR